MKIKILKLIASPDGVFQPDSVVDMEKEKALRIIKAGAGICVDEKPKEIKKEVEIETAEIKIPEKQVILKKKKN